MKKINVGIAGGAGYTGGELIRILIHHPQVNITFIHSSSNAGKPVSAVHTDLVGDTDLVFSNSFSDKIKFFFKQHNEHRILYDKLWFYIVYWFNPEGLDFNILSLIGTLSLVGIVAFYFFKLKKHYSDYILLFPVSVFIINLALWENITFSMAGLSNFTFLLFAILSIHFITQENLNSKKMGFSLFFFFFSSSFLLLQLCNNMRFYGLINN